MPNPSFFVDRSMGAHLFPAALRAVGWTLVTMDERYGTRGRAVPDIEWIADAAQSGEAMICKDLAIARVPHEAQAIVMNDARIFALSVANVSAQEMVRRFVNNQVQIYRMAARSGPYVVSVRETSIRRVPLNYPPR
jgi:PIN like domain